MPYCLRYQIEVPKFLLSRISNSHRAYIVAILSVDPVDDIQILGFSIPKLASGWFSRLDLPS